MSLATAEKPGGGIGALQLDSSGALRITPAGLGGGATEAKQDDQIVQLDAIIDALGAAGLLAKEATQQDVLTVLGTLGTETTLEAVVTALGASGVLAKETTLADVRTAVQAIQSSAATTAANTTLLVSQTDSLEADLAAVKAQTDSLETDLAAIKAQTDGLEADLAAVKDRIMPPDASSYDNGAALNGLIVNSGMPKTLWTIYAHSTVLADRFLMVFDQSSASAPSNGTIPKDVIQIPGLGDGPAILAIPKRYTNGIYWHASTTGDAFTAATGTPLAVHARYS